MNTLSKVKSAIESGNAKEVFNIVSASTWIGSKNLDFESKECINPSAETIIELVAANSNDFTKDIANKAIDSELNLSAKQAWCIAYQVVNNKEVYLSALVGFSKKCSNAAFEVLKEMYPNKTDEQIKALIG
jgi:hypothetical protein